MCLPRIYVRAHIYSQFDEVHINQMDDFSTTNLNEARNEFAQRLVTVLTPRVIDGFNKMFEDTYKNCVLTREPHLHMSTFQNKTLSSVITWNAVTVEAEKNKIMVEGNCPYLADLLTCVHIIQVKILSCMRVGNRQKAIELPVPNLNTFIHNVYITVARKLFFNTYLYQVGVADMVRQKNNRDLEILVQECIMIVVRDLAPVDTLIRAYLDESVEQEEEVFIEPVPDADAVAEVDADLVRAKMSALGQAPAPSTIPDLRPPHPIAISPQSSSGGGDGDGSDNRYGGGGGTIAPTPVIRDLNDEPIVTRLTFNDVDETNEGDRIHAPKTIERLDRLAAARTGATASNDSGADIVITGDNSATSLFDFDPPSPKASQQGLVLEEFSL